MSRDVVITCDKCGTTEGRFFRLVLTRPSPYDVYDKGYYLERDLCETCGEILISDAGLPENDRGFLRRIRG